MSEFERKSSAAINYTARKMQRLEERLERLEALLLKATSRHQTRPVGENGEQTDDRGPRS